MPENTDFVWHGKQEFLVSGTDRRENTLWVETNHKQPTEHTMRLTLPTLCITYADMEFANAVGGIQKNYPDSSEYGTAYFDPPVELIGEDEVEKFTWIRGAQRVIIRPDQTQIEWYLFKHLVIPRLRIDRKAPTAALLEINDIRIPISRPLVVKIKQFFDGRHIGGVRIEKRHPDWKPEEKPEQYDLWVQIIDGETKKPVPKARLKLFRWDPNIPPKGDFGPAEQQYTDERGIVRDSEHQSGDLEAILLDMPGWRSVARCFRPLAGQHVRLMMRAFRLEKNSIRYTWQKKDTLDGVAKLTGFSAYDILEHNRFEGPTMLTEGVTINLPCYAASYRTEPGDTPEWLAKAFAYPGIEELAKLNGLIDPSKLHSGMKIRLPGWYFFYARRGDTLEHIDELFSLPKGSTRTVGKVHHPDPNRPYECETIAVPSKRFVKTYMNQGP